MAMRKRTPPRRDAQPPRVELQLLPPPEQLLAEARESLHDTPQQDSSTNRLGWPATAFIVLVVVAGGLVIGIFAPQLDRSDLLGVALLTMLALAAGRFNIAVYGDTHVSLAFVPTFAAVVLYGVPGAVVAGPLAAATVRLSRRISLLQVLFNVGNIALAASLGAVTFHVVAGSYNGEVDIRVVPGALTGAVVTYAVNAYLVDQVVALTTRRSLHEVWNEQDRWLFPHYAVLGFLGLALALAYDSLGVAGLLAFLAPPVMMQLSIKQYIERTTENVAALRRKNEQLETANRDILEMSHRLRETYHGTLEALVSALDARDRETKGHSSRVCAYTLDIARLLGLEEGSVEWLDIQRAALLHDVGKIGVTDFILHKPGPLSPEEWKEMRRHPDIGYEMLKEVSFLNGPAAVVRAHHERFDGKGYPRGLKGTEIPLGARIFAVADTFDAMTSDRPYRRALPPETAREEILRNGGTQFDPEVVEVFLKVYEKWVARKARPREARRAA